MTAVTLHCQADINKLIATAHGARRAVLQGTTTEKEDGENRKQLDAFLLKRTAHFVETLSLCTTLINKRLPDADITTEEEASKLEAEVQELQGEVLAASQRVAGLRSTVPAALSEHLKGSLEQCRPSTPEHVEAAAEAAEASPVTPAPGDGMTPAPAELQGKFAGATAQIPTLRAKLEEALERLQRILAVMAADAQQAPPNTVERAARGLATPAAAVKAAARTGLAAASEGTPSPKLAEAVSSGKIVTRRRIASSLRPVPYPRP